MDRRIGIYTHPLQLNLGEFDVFRDADGTWMYASNGEVGDLPEDWWHDLAWVGPRTYPPPAYFHPDFGTFAFGSRQSVRDVFVCDRCGAAMQRGDLPDDQWPGTACQWCPAGTLIRRLLRPGESLADEGPDFARSPFGSGRDFRDALNWREARVHLAAWRRREAARHAAGPDWVYRLEDERHPCAVGLVRMAEPERPAVAVGARIRLIHVTPGKAIRSLADVPVRDGTVTRVWRKPYASEDCARVRFDDGTDWSGVPLSHLVALDEAGNPVVDETASAAPVLGGVRRQRPEPLVAGDRVELIKVDPCKRTPSLESVACRTGKVVRIYIKKGDVEPVAHVWFEDGVEWLGLPFDYLRKLASSPRPRPEGPNRDAEGPGNAPALR